MRRREGGGFDGYIFTKKTDMKIAAPGSSPESRYTTTNQNKHSLRIPLDRKAKNLL